MVGEHTPGPWEITEIWDSPKRESGLVYCRIGNKDSVGFAGAYLSRHGRPDAEARANARLIAAAPELYELLDELVHQAGQCMACGGFRHAHEDFCRYGAVLAKVEGQHVHT